MVTKIILQLEVVKWGHNLHGKLESHLLKQISARRRRYVATTGHATRGTMIGTSAERNGIASPKTPSTDPSDKVFNSSEELTDLPRSFDLIPEVFCCLSPEVMGILTFCIDVKRGYTVISQNR